MDPPRIRTHGRERHYQPRRTRRTPRRRHHPYDPTTQHTFSRYWIGRSHPSTNFWDKSLGTDSAPLIIDPASEPEPDLAVVFGAPREYVNEHPRTALLVIEISDTSLDKDRNRKLPLYAQAGIPEYWIVNLVDQCLEVYRDPVSSQNEQPAQYRTSITLGAKDNVSPSAQPEHTIAVSDLLP